MIQEEVFLVIIEQRPLLKRTLFSYKARKNQHDIIGKLT